MIGMILLAVIAVSIFFGITYGFFSRMGIANWVAFLVVLAFAVAAVFPPLVTGGRVSLSYAGFFLPLLLGIVCMFAIGANSSLLRAVVGAVAIAGITVAARVALTPTGSYADSIASILIVGFCGGIAAFIIGQGRLAMLGAVLIGVVLGDFITAMLFRFAIGVTGSMFLLGQNGIFDSAVMAAVVGGIAIEIGNLVKRTVFARSSVPAAAQTEAAQDNNIDENGDMIPREEDEDLYEDYFNDDID